MQDKRQTVDGPHLSQVQQAGVAVEAESIKGHFGWRRAAAWDKPRSKNGARVVPTRSTSATNDRWKSRRSAVIDLLRLGQPRSVLNLYLHIGNK